VDYICAIFRIVLSAIWVTSVVHLGAIAALAVYLQHSFLHKFVFSLDLKSLKWFGDGM